MPVLQGEWALSVGCLDCDTRALYIGAFSQMEDLRVEHRQLHAGHLASEVLISPTCLRARRVIAHGVAG